MWQPGLCVRSFSFNKGLLDNPKTKGKKGLCEGNKMAKHLRGALYKITQEETYCQSDAQGMTFSKHSQEQKYES